MVTFPLTGTWRPGQISIVWSESSWPLNPRVQEIIDQTWLAATTRPGIHLFDGPMCRLEKFESRGQALHLTLSLTSYKLFYGTNLNDPGLEALANPVGLSALVTSSDGFILMGRRNAHVAYHPNLVHPFAGTLEPRDNLDVFDDIRRELREEISLSNGDILDLLCLGIAQDRAIRQPELIFVARSNRTRGQIESQLDPAEHAGIWAAATSRQSLEGALGQPQPFTPIGVAALLLFGRQQFGDEWFARQRDIITG